MKWLGREKFVRIAPLSSLQFLTNKQMTNTLKTNKQEELKDLITTGIKCWKSAGLILVELLDTQDLCLDEIAEETGLTTRLLSRFEQLGRDQLIPELLIADFHASKNLQRLPYSEQRRLIEGTVEVLASDQGDKLLILTKNLTSQQCKQVFTSTTVRDLGAQRAWVESQKQKRSETVTISDMPYHISKKEVFFDKGCKMNANQLISILAQIK